MRNSSGRTILGKLGEALLYSEILKKGFNCYILGNHNINSLADIIVEGNITLEVKTAVYSRNCKRSTYSYVKESADKAYASGWQFGALKRSISDYYVFVLLEEDLSLYKFLVFPRDSIKRDQFFYLRPSAGDFKGGKGRSRVETVIDPINQGLNLIFERLNALKSNV
ncbi:MAG: hypothetical protein G01um10147_719 [Microgenomates group bacterium Gr01-1014_7]|nr:MAG: hypothetical protein G01um10147_719 [Microgenomates group bacterium Gr01-1014_7]